MRRIVIGLLALLAVSAHQAIAQAPPFPQTLPANSVLGRMGVSPGPAQAIPFTTLAAQLGAFNKFSNVIRLNSGSSRTVTVGELGTLFIVDTGTPNVGNFNINLPAASTAPRGSTVTVAKDILPNHAGSITILPNGSDTIQGQPRLRVYALGFPLTLASDGVSKWYMSAPSWDAYLYSPWKYTHTYASNGVVLQDSSEWPDIGGSINQFQNTLIGNHFTYVVPAAHNCAINASSYMLVGTAFQKRDGSLTTSFATSGYTVRIKPQSGETIEQSQYAWPLSAPGDTVEMFCDGNELRPIYIPAAHAGVNGLRLSATTAAIPLAPVTASATLYLWPYESSRIAVPTSTSSTSGIYRWILHDIPFGLTRTLTTSNCGTATTANNIYDVFIWQNIDGDLVLFTGPAWASPNSRPTGSSTSELILLDGVWVNKYGFSCTVYAPNTGILPLSARYVGTISTDGSNRINFAGAARDGFQIAYADLPARYDVWNFNNRVRIRVAWSVPTTSASYNVSTSGAWQSQAANASAYVFNVRGMQEDVTRARYQANVSGGIAGQVFGMISIAIDGTTPTGDASKAISSNAPYTSLTSVAEMITNEGTHLFRPVELTTGGTMTSWNQIASQGAINMFSVELMQ